MHNPLFQNILPEDIPVMLKRLHAYTKSYPKEEYIRHAGDPADFIKRLSGRMKVCHFKDYKINSENKPDFAEVGTGNLNLDECYRACRDSGVRYIVIEQDTCDIDPHESMAISYKNLVDIAKRNS